MRNRRLWATLFLTLLIPAGMATAQPAPTNSPAPAAAPAEAASAGPAISDATRAATGELNDSQKAEVDAFVKSCAGKLLAGGGVKTIQAIRGAMLDASTRGPGAGFLRYFATSATANFAPNTLKSKDVLVQVNAALALASISHPAMSPVLRQMAVDANAGVRYCGMKACRDLRPSLLTSTDTTGIDAILTLLQDRGRVETSPAVLGLIFQAMDFAPKGALANTNAALLTGPQNRSRAIVAASLAAHLQGVRDGDGGMSGAYAEAVKTIESITGGVPDAEKTKVLQALAEVLANAGEAYQELSSQKGATAPDELAGLLRATEGALGRLTGKGEAAVGKALDGMAPRGVAVKLAVNGWVGNATSPGILNAAPFNVKPPVVLKAGKIAMATPAPAAR